MISQHLAMFAGHWSGASGNMKYLICHATSLTHVIEGLCNFMSGSSSFYVTTLPSLVVLGVAVVEICFQFVT